MPKGQEIQQVRCLNCFIRVPTPPRIEKLTCPNCGVKYAIGWREGQPKIMGLAKG
jgi:predicted RNA-binding Zn-ribbon protein involved in translation (DUF1610 family)